jgi:hypothetical protein
MSRERSFVEDLAFLRRHRETLELLAPDGRGRIAVVPEFQGRVMTSSAGASSGRSFGFLKDECIASRRLARGINPYGGEDRLWLGPEGGPFALFFAPEARAQTLEHWQTPAVVDSEPFTLVAVDAHQARFEREARLANRAGSSFELRLERTVRVLDARAASAELGLDVDGLECVAFESDNVLTNTGRAAWTRRTGMLSLWVLGMFKPSPTATVILPLAAPLAVDPAEHVNDAYFGRVPAERLRRVASVGGSALLFRADGAYRSKIGVAPPLARPLAASFDAERQVLTLVTFTLPSGECEYVDSTWGPQANPFRGDAVHSYNDGPSAPGAASFGPFYELESSSPAAALAPGESLAHRHRTLHCEGPRAALEQVVDTLFGLDLDALTWR